MLIVTELFNIAVNDFDAKKFADCGQVLFVTELLISGTQCSTIVTLLLPANEVWGKVICLHLSVILSTGGVPGPGGCLVLGGCLVPGGAWWRSPGRVLLRAVRILLECILVFTMFLFAEVEHKPDLVWPTSSHIVSTAMSSCTSLVAVAVDSGIVTIRDKYIGSVSQQTGGAVSFARYRCKMAGNTLGN